MLLGPMSPFHNVELRENYELIATMTGYGTCAGPPTART
ncbi:hypothetical protein EDD30_3790 [Couchioplanes caeruleus]|uniref:Uncharacterized protein n=1 Tax=Couchioplanes caeruleus TaxID=56438 RepID=A0A3N1GKW6_9ACTN|nr:hypothetical protein EDD30_3790 [Couchioplanes caeruleus]